MRSYQDKPDSTSWGGRTSSTSTRSRPARRSTARNTRTGRREGRVTSCAVRHTRATGRRGERGFTLIELLVVISLISILAAMGLVQYRNSVQRTKEATLQTRSLPRCATPSISTTPTREVPASLDALVSDGYMRKIPDDPITKSADTWQTVPAEADPGNPSAEPGIYDVKSGAPGTALDGTAIRTGSSSQARARQFAGSRARGLRRTPHQPASSNRNLLLLTAARAAVTLMNSWLPPSGGSKRRTKKDAARRQRPSRWRSAASDSVSACRRRRCRR